MPNLTDAQLVILAKAAQRNNGAVLPLPRSLTLNKGAASSVLSSLLRHGLVRERPATRRDPVWRTVKGEKRTLVITDAGRAAIGVIPDSDGAELANAKAKAPKNLAKGSRRTAPTSPAPSPSPTVRAGTKLAAVIALLHRKQGATIAEISEETGWQPHSVRGALSGALKRKRGLAVRSETVPERGRVYRIGGDA